jgi:hypothetical protein
MKCARRLAIWVAAPTAVAERGERMRRREREREREVIRVAVG